MARTYLPRLTGAAAPQRDRVHIPGALKYPQFRNYWLGLVASVTGYQMLILFCLGWLITHELDGDARDLGYMTTAIAVPAIGLNLFGGAFADKLEPKRLLGFTQLTTGAIVIALAVVTSLDAVERWHVLVAAFFIGAMQAFDTPTRQSIFPRLLDRRALPAAVALNSSVWTGTRIFAPAIAGVIVGRAEISTAIFVSAAGFIFLALVAQTLAMAPVERARGGVLDEIMVGFRFVRGHRIFLILIGMTFFNSMFGISYVFLMPAFADEVLQIGPEKLGWLMGVAGTGGLTGIILGVILSRKRYKGWVVIGGATFFGIFLILFALASNAGHYGLSMAMLFLADMSISIYLMGVMITLQLLVPDQFRGRVMGFYSMTWSMVPLGGLLSSQIAFHVSPPAAVAVGGALVIALALGVGLRSRQVRSLGDSASQDRTL